MGAAQIFILEFSKGGLAELDKEFVDSGAANQPVILQGCVGPPSDIIASFSQTSKGFLKLVTDFMVNVFFDEVKKTGGILLSCDFSVS